MHEPPETLARGEGNLGELVLRRRAGSPPVYELVVNGVFLMDTAETSSERLLAEAVMRRTRAPHRVLVGGLGLGYTVGALLTDSRIQRIDVVEIEPLLIRWLRDGLVPDGAAVMSDRRVKVTIGDVADALSAAEPASYDAVLLDVDNGPGFLVHERNAAIYQHDSLLMAARALRPGGTLAVWSASPSTALSARMAAVVGPVEDIATDVIRDGRPMTYHIYLATATTVNR
ncbi:MAG TPA: hypothetical protein VFZ63_18210 [Jiangellaceae bacterium]